MDPMMHDGRPVVAFADAAELDEWLRNEHLTHRGVWIRLRRTRATVPRVTFHDLLEAGIAYGWSESTRHCYDADSYLQRFGPRRTRGTASQRNRLIAEQLRGAGRMTPEGFRALGLEST